MITEVVAVCQYGHELGESHVLMTRQTPRLGDNQAQHTSTFCAEPICGAVTLIIITAKLHSLHHLNSAQIRARTDPAVQSSHLLILNRGARRSTRIRAALPDAATHYTHTHIRPLNPLRLHNHMGLLGCRLRARPKPSQDAQHGCSAQEREPPVVSAGWRG